MGEAGHKVGLTAPLKAVGEAGEPARAQLARDLSHHVRAGALSKHTTRLTRITGAGDRLRDRGRRGREASVHLITAVSGGHATTALLTPPLGERVTLRGLHEALKGAVDHVDALITRGARLAELTTVPPTLSENTGGKALLFAAQVNGAALLHTHADLA